MQPPTTSPRATSARAPARSRSTPQPYAWASPTRSGSSTAGLAKGLVVGSEYNTGASVESCPAPCLGYSFITQNPVLPDLLDRLPVTLSLAAGAAVLWLFGGVATGVVSALKRGSPIDRTAMGVALAGVSLPIFFTGLLALSIFSYGLGWTAQGGSYTPFQENPAKWAYDLLLPTRLHRAHRRGVVLRGPATSPTWVPGRCVRCAATSR